MTVATGAVSAESLKTTDDWYYAVEASDAAYSKMSVEQILDMANMPESMLFKCTTNELAKLVLEHPLLINILFFDDHNVGLEYFKNTSNIFREFFSREDYMDALVDEYVNINIDYSAIVEAACNENEVDMDFIKREKELPKRVFMNIFFMKNKEKLTIEHQARIEKYILTETKRTDYQEFFACELDVARSVTVNIQHRMGTYTLYGESILAYELYGVDFNSDQVYVMNSYVDSRNPSLIRVADAAGAYNCHSYAWITMNTSQNIWYVPDPSVWASTDYFTPVNMSDGTQMGDVVLIYSGSTVVHSAVVVSGGTSLTGITVKSKLGVGGVYRGTLARTIAAYGGTSYEIYR